MNITTKLDNLNQDLIEQYLTALGISDVKHFLKPVNANFESWKNYKNMREAVALLNKHQNPDTKFGILVDSDADGACSAAIVYKFLNSDNCQTFFHTGKQHGLKDTVDRILEANLDLLFIPDAGSNDVNECKRLQESGVDIIILDHHLIEEENPYACVVNNQVEGVENKALSGAGVTDKFVQAFCDINKYKYGVDIPSFYDLVAVSLVSDICDLSTMENRGYIYRGLRSITNPFLSLLFEKLCQRRGYTPDGIGWNIAPLANALARSDEQESKTLFFDGLVGKISPEEALKQMRRVKRLQDEEVKAVVEEIEPNLDVSSKVILGFTEPQNASFTGLIANKFNGKYNKPTLLLRDTGYNSWSGSLRSPVPLATKINESGLASAQGHEEACGILVKKNNLDKFQKWLETLDLSERPDIQVTAQVNPEDITLDVCQVITDCKQLWGHGIEAPTFYIKTILTQDDVYVFEKSTTTIKLDLNGLSCLKFFAKPQDVKAFNQYDKFNLELIVGDLSINEYNGYTTPQCNIIDYEISSVIDSQEIDDNWEEWF